MQVVTYLTFQRPSSGQSSAVESNASASDETVTLGLTSSVKGITATIRGAPSTPLKIRVAETSAFRLINWACFALLRRFRRDRAAGLDVGDDVGP